MTSTVALAAQSSCGSAAPQYQFTVTPPGGANQVVRGYAPEGAATFDATSGPGRYALTAYVRPEGSTASYDAYATRSYFAGDVCATATLDPIVTPREGFSIIELTARAACSGTAMPEYRFLVKMPGATAWSEFKPWSTEWYASMGVTPSGRYRYLVEARAVGNRSTYEAWTEKSVLVGATCTAASVTATPDGAGNMLVSASATCPLATPEYRIMVRAPGQTTFAEARPYGTDASFAFSLANKPFGRWEFQVWARGKGNASDYEAMATASGFWGATCSQAGLSAQVDSGANVVDLQATSTCSGGGSGEYRFLVRRPGATAFVEVRPYSYDPGVAFHEHGPLSPGRYEFKVLVRYPYNLSDWEATATTSAFVGETCADATLTAQYDGMNGVVDLDATASCGQVASQYRFLARKPGTASFVEVRPYGSGASFTVHPDRGGRWEFRVEARGFENPSDWETTATTAALVGSACTAATITSRWDGVTGVVSVEATASCATGQPELRFFVRRPGETVFRDLRAWSPDKSVQYTLDPPLFGRYEFKVHARVVGNASDWEATATASTLVGNYTCASSALTATFDGYARVNLSATAACGAPEYRFMVRAPGATAFTELRGWGASPQLEHWLPYPVVPGRWEFLVYARQNGNSSDYESSAKASVLVGQTCSSTILLGDLVTASGTTFISLFANASCGQASNAQYRFLVRPPGATAFSQLRGWGTEKQVDYTPPPAAPGRYEFQVQARLAGNVSDYEATATTAILLGATCRTAFLDTSTTGATVDLSAGSACATGATPEYRFLARRPGEASFSEIRAYGAEPRLSMLPSPYLAGRWELQVQVRAAGNGSQYESTATSTVYLGSVCRAASLVARYGSNLLNAFASASCDSANPEYRFQLRGPGETAFRDVRSWSMDSWFATNELLLPGRHEVRVLVRAGGNRDWDAQATSSVNVGFTCSSAALTTTRPAGTTDLQLDASAACYPGVAEYRFLVKGPGEVAFHELRAYGPESRVTVSTDAGAGKIPWPPSLATPGRYEFQLRARVLGNTSDWEALASTTAWIGTSCSAAGLAATFEDGPDVRLAASAACKVMSPEYRFLARPPGTAAFREVRGYAADPRTAVLPVVAGGSSPIPGRWEFQVAVRAGGNTEDEATATASVLVGRACGGAALVANRGGSVVELSAAAACRWGAPEYRFLARRPGDSAFVEVRPYGSGPSWTTLAMDHGRHEFQVQVRAEGNASDWEAQASAAASVGFYTESVTLSAVRTSPGIVSLEAASAMYSGPELRFSFRPVGAASFTELQAYGPSASYGWNVGSLPNGRYEVLVQARNAGNASPWEAQATVVVTIDPM